MDVYNFINSKDIECHLRSINYKFTTLEISWLIYQCKKISLTDKINFWYEVIKTMPDCEIPKRTAVAGYCNPQIKSLHQYLSEFSRVLSENIKKFFDRDENSKYVYLVTYLNHQNISDVIHISIESCLKEIKETQDDDEDIGLYQISKRNLNEIEDIIDLIFLPDGRPFEIFNHQWSNDKNLRDFLNYWEYSWFDFPTPFSKGDIVCIPNKYKGEKSPFVLRGICNWKPSEIIKSHGDMSDMTAFGYVLDLNGNVNYKVFCEYMDLEYYEEELQINKIFLKHLSNYFKNKIGIDFLLTTYQRCLIDICKDNNDKNCRFYDDKFLKENGINLSQ